MASTDLKTKHKPLKFVKSINSLTPPQKKRIEQISVH